MTTTTTTLIKIRRTSGDGLHDNERLSSDLSFAKESDWILWEEFSYPNATIRLTDGDGVNAETPFKTGAVFTSADEALDYINTLEHRLNRRVSPPHVFWDNNGTWRPIPPAHVYTIDMEGRVRRLKLGYINQFDRWNAD